jgi:2-dehydropantoate 2-reductase
MIYGAGSLGTVLGAYLARAGVPVVLVNRNKDHVFALNEKGARVVGTVAFTASVKAVLPEDITGEYDLIILMTKQQQNREVVGSLLPHLAKDGVLCTAQNGLPERLIASIVGDDRVVGCTVAWGATLRQPGCVELTSDPGSMSFDIGTIDASSEDKLKRVAMVLDKMCPVHIKENFLGARWSKLLINAAFSGLSAVFGKTFGEVAKDKQTRRIAQHVIKECIDTAKAGGIRIEPVQGKDVARLMDYKNAAKRQIAYMLIPLAMKKHRMIKAGMLQDLEKGKPTEVDSINGAVSAWGRMVHVPTPFNDRITDMIHEMEQGRRKPGMDNLGRFGDLLYSQTT